jgi:hypothetical protein
MSRPANAIHEGRLLTTWQKFLQFFLSETKVFRQLLGRVFQLVLLSSDAKRSNGSMQAW